MADYYDTLGVAKGASDQDIKTAYRKLALKYHPDRNQGDSQAEERFKKISEAYAVLSDKQKRQQYDMFGDNQFHQRYSSEDIFRGTDFGSIFSEFGFGGPGGAGAGGMEDILSSLFGGQTAGRRGGGGFGGFQQRPQKGQDVEYPLQVGFMDAFQGGERRVSFRLNDGTQRELTVKIPIGVKDGTKLRIPSRGAPSPHGGPAGDLFVIIQVAGHPDFERVGDDIESPLHLKLSDALLGCSASVSTPSGDKKIKVPAGVTPGTKIRLKGLGFSAGGKNGDLYAVVQYEIPKSFSRDQKKAIEALQETGL